MQARTLAVHAWPMPHHVISLPFKGPCRSIEEVSVKNLLEGHCQLWSCCAAWLLAIRQASHHCPVDIITLLLLTGWPHLGSMLLALLAACESQES